jgi:hypothetical protein
MTMNTRQECVIKAERPSAWLARNQFNGVLLSKVSNYSWLLCGQSNQIVGGSQKGTGPLLFWKGRLYLLSDHV